MKTVQLSLLIIFCLFFCMKGYPIYGYDSPKNGCGPSKGYDPKDDKSVPIKVDSSGSSTTSSTSGSSSNDSSKNK